MKNTSTSVDMFGKRKNSAYLAVYEENMTQTEQIHTLKLKNKQ